MQDPHPIRPRLLNPVDELPYKHVPSIPDEHVPSIQDILKEQMQMAFDQCVAQVFKAVTGVEYDEQSAEQFQLRIFSESFNSDIRVSIEGKVYGVVRISEDFSFGKGHVMKFTFYPSPAFQALEDYQP